jgi:hypothetical protein
MREMLLLLTEADIAHLASALADWRHYCIMESRHLTTMRHAPNVADMLQTEAGWVSDMLDTVETQVQEQA